MHLIVSFIIFKFDLIHQLFFLEEKTFLTVTFHLMKTLFKTLYIIIIIQLSMIIIKPYYFIIIIKPHLLLLFTL
jgi:hypothetical protein